MLNKKVSELSLYPKFKCLCCGEKLWVKKTNRQEILETLDGRKHLKTQCNLQTKPVKFNALKGRK